MNSKARDIGILVFINIFAVSVSFLFRTNLFTSTVLFLGVPSLYLLRKETPYLRNIFLATIAFGVFFSFVFDFVAELNRAWDWNSGLLFGKILGVVQADVMAWFFLWILHIFLFYEHFIDREKLKSRISRRQLEVLGVSVFSLVLLVVAYRFFPSVLYFGKAYLVLCLFVSVPFAIICILKPKLVLHTLPMVAYFSFVYLSHEITALRLNHWLFPGDYIGWVSIDGASFPVEELVFWVVLSSLIGGLYYEVSFDNQKN